MSDQKLKNKIVEKLLRKRVVGGHKKQKDTVANWFRSSDQGKVKNLMDGMAADTKAPLEMYGGGQRENVRLTSVEDAVDYLKDNGGDVPFGF
jgi:hypothetical protein